jgi:hypothetical protein
MPRRMEKLIGVRLAEPAYSLVEELARESDRTVAGLARRLLYERLGQIAAERQHQPGSITETAGAGGTAAAA